MLKSVLENKKLIANLAKDDFKKKFAGSSLGVIWAFVQPVITVFIYWFVFEKGLHAEAANLRTGVKIPYVLWLMAGLIPWFYLQEAWNGGTAVLLEYSYLVKKVVFKIEVLPVVKVVSSLFTHAFLMGFMVFLFWVMGFTPDLYTLQILYYSFAMICLVTGLSYITGAIVVFFKDMAQIVGIILQIGVWATPIMWRIEELTGIPEWLTVVLRLNPMYYVVSGYRDALINKISFWEHPYLTVWFWALTILVYVAGTRTFKKLRVHFADVL